MLLTICWWCWHKGFWVATEWQSHGLSQLTKGQTLLKVLWTWKSGEGLAAQTLNILLFVVWVGAQSVPPSSFLSVFLLHTLRLCACVCVLSFSGISLAFKALRACAFGCFGARSIYQGCRFALWAGLFQSFSYRQFDIACQRQQLQQATGKRKSGSNSNSNNNGKVNTQSTKHLFTAITEIFLHSTWHWKRVESSRAGHVTFLSVIQSYAHTPCCRVPEVLVPHARTARQARHVKVSSK